MLLFLYKISAYYGSYNHVITFIMASRSRFTSSVCKKSGCQNLVLHVSLKAAISNPNFHIYVSSTGLSYRIA